MSELPASLVMRAKINRLWIGYLTPAEFSVVSFIYERTYPYGKDAEKIYVDHFMYGVVTSDGTLLHAPLKLSRATLMRSLAALRKYGAVMASGSEREVQTYALNPVWNPERSGLKMRLAKSQNETSVVSKRDQSSLNMRPLTKEDNMGKKLGIKTGDGSAAPSFVEKLQGVGHNSTLKRQARIAKGGRYSWETVWHDTWKDFHPDWPKPTQWTGVDYKMFRQSFGRFPDLDVVAFIRWTIENWRTVLGRVPQLNKYGSLPKLRGFVRHMEALVDTYHKFTGKIVIAGAPEVDPQTALAAKDAENAALRERIKSLSQRPSAAPTAPPPRPATPTRPRDPYAPNPAAANMRPVDMRGVPGFEDEPTPRTGLRKRFK